MKKRFDFKTTALLSAVLGSAVMLTACSGDSDDTQKAQAPAAEQSTMAVKQPAPVEAPKQALQAEPAPAPVQEAVKEVEKQVVEKVEAVKEEVAQVAAAPAGDKLYSTCVGCHGANGEGGVGPRLNNQSVDDVVAKLEKYKAGEQIGPMTAMMAPMATPLSTDDMKAIAEYITAK